MKNFAAFCRRKLWSS